MKSIYKVLTFLSILAVIQMGLNAKPIELLFENSTESTFSIERPNTRQLRIENIGTEPLTDCLPFANQTSFTSLEKIAAYLANQNYPLLALFDLWNRSMIRDESLTLKECHPLDLLLFKGACPPEAFDTQFLKLCQALGIQMRQAQVRGQTVYDFSCEKNDWAFLDLHNGRYYLSIENNNLASSEDIMDDPFLALRTKHDRSAKATHFQESWQQLARFNILEPAAAPEIIFNLENLPNRLEGFTLYPNEILLFDTPDACSELPTHQHRITHTLALEVRQVEKDFSYASPIPMQTLENNSTSSLYLPNQNLVIQPGESCTFFDDHLFTLTMQFSESPQGTLALSGTVGQLLFPALQPGDNQLALGSKENPSLIRVTIDMDDTTPLPSIPPIIVANPNHEFDYCTPAFELSSPSNQEMQQIWWQISLDPDFTLIPPSLDQIENYQSTVTLSSIHETFLNPDRTYYFRVRGSSNSAWGNWSPVFPFTVNKPAAAQEIEFDKIDDNLYEINWQRMAEEASEQIEYLVFGSNALDFIPSIFCDKQINGVVKGAVIEEELDNNLITITTEPKIHVKGHLAYYRIIARQRGQLSTPSELVHVYDYNLVQPRNVLQLVEDDAHNLTTKRMLLPVSYPAVEVALPHVLEESLYENSLLKIQSLLRSATNPEAEPYQRPPEISEEIWDSWQKYLLPCNHPLKPKLDRIFSSTRVTLTPSTCKRAGFTRYTPQRWSRVVASPHGSLPGYWCKMYCDDELRVLHCHTRWINRIYGAACIRKCIKENHLEKVFNAPHKWMYVLPNNFPKQYKNNPRYVPKYTILICEDARPVDHSKNKTMYKHISDRQIIKGLYTIIQTCGLWDSVFSFNNPFSKDGRIWFIDCEGHHRWPIKYQKMTKTFSSEMGLYWEYCFQQGSIPDGVSDRGLRRTDL